MKNNFFRLVDYLYYFSLAILFILYLFPGSLIGYLLYGDMGRQPNLINNPFGTSINHLFFFIYLSVLGFISRLRNKKLINSFQVLFCISILLEILHWIIPNRAFEYYDLFANSAGVLLVYFLFNFFLKKKLTNMNNFNIIVILLLISSSQILAGEISGVPSITDGDTIKISNKRIRFHGIDTPERKQICTKNSKEYNCGKEATDALTKKINGKPVLCKVQDKLDIYKRYIGVCFVEEVNLNKWMVRNGYALAYKRYSKDYTEDEEYAKKNKLGLWAGNFIHPEKWRKLN
tara:strand:- start:182 stop:1048 length:867 start_codon:yes stop_codon:yes gene_type:complete